MKKLAIIFLLIMFPVFAFTGCGGHEENFWSETYDMARGLLTVSEDASEENNNIAKILSSNEGIVLTGNEDFLNAISEHNAYKELKIYEYVLKSNIHLTNQYLQQIDFAPSLIHKDNLKDIAPQFTLFEKEIDNLRRSVRSFLREKMKYETRTIRSDFVATSVSNLQHLRDFKLLYINLIGDVISFNNQFENIFIDNYMRAFQTITNDIVLDVHYVKLGNALTKKIIAESFFEMVISPSNGKPIHDKFHNAKIVLEKTKDIIFDTEELDVLMEEEDITSNYLKLKEIYNLVKSEKNQVLSLIENIDLSNIFNQLVEVENNSNFIPTLEQQKALAAINYWNFGANLLVNSAFRNIV